MNKFYSIGEEDKEVQNEFQLKNLGKRKVVGQTRPDPESFYKTGIDRRIPQDVYGDIVDTDYDQAFVWKITLCKPSYKALELLNHHYLYFKENVDYEGAEFIKHIRYVVLPILNKWRGFEVQKQVLNDWLAEIELSKRKKEIDVNMSFGDINAPSQFQVGSPGASQNQAVKYKNENVLELFRMLQSDLDKLEDDLREDFKIEIDNAIRQLNRGKDISSRLLTIGGLMKDVGIGTLTNLIASPVFEVMKPYLGLH